MLKIRNYKPPMSYRTFGKTNIDISVITLGTMRFIHGWDEPADEIAEDTFQDCEDALTLAMDCGINLIETAKGYTKSEHCLGITLNERLKIPRDNYYLMTKGAAESGKDMRETVSKQLKALRTDYFDFYAYHGMNNQEIFDICFKKGSPIEELVKMKKEGIIRNIGFSGHGGMGA